MLEIQSIELFNSPQFSQKYWIYKQNWIFALSSWKISLFLINGNGKVSSFLFYWQSSLLGRLKILAVGFFTQLVNSMVFMINLIFEKISVVKFPVTATRHNVYIFLTRSSQEKCWRKNYFLRPRNEGLNYIHKSKTKHIHLSSFWWNTLYNISYYYS